MDTYHERAKMEGLLQGSDPIRITAAGKGDAAKLMGLCGYVIVLQGALRDRSQLQMLSQAPSEQVLKAFPVLGLACSCLHCLDTF